MGGRDVTDYLAKQLTEQGSYLTSTSEREICRDIKEKLGYVALNCEEEQKISKNYLEKSYQLPDGQMVTIGSERFRCAEGLFSPHLLGLQEPGLHQLVYKCIMSCDMDIRKSFYGNIIVSGGSTLFRGLPERLTKEIIELAPATMKVKVISPPLRKYSVWIGGSMLTSLSTFRSKWITKQQYDEYGPSVIHKYCYTI